jgi:hypothetical protein
MSPEEARIIQTIILTLSDPNGNWDYAWRQLCKLADADPERHKPPFKNHPLDPHQESDQKPLEDGV